MDCQKELFGKSRDGREVVLYTLSNQQKVTVKIMTYGGIITSLHTPDRDGEIADLVLGFHSLEEYLGEHPYFGAIIGRYANRIASGRFVLDRNEYQLALNEGKNHLHGGDVGFDKVIWQAEAFKQPGAVGLRLSYLSGDGEEGYPGNLNVTVRYQLTDQNELVIEYEAVTDRPTVVNLTNHSYFNLNGEGRGDILGHELMINADYYTAVDEGLIPTGELPPVQGTPLDFRTAQPIGARIGETRGGYDHNYVLRKEENELSLAARVFAPESGRVMEVFTTEPGIQLYTANSFTGSFIGKTGKAYPKHGAFCLETQHFPDSPNQAHFPTTRLDPGETYRSTTIYQFSVE